MNTGIRVACLAVAVYASLAAGPHALTLGERIDGADVVVVGTTRAVTPRWQSNAWGDRVIVSRIVVDVDETLKGTTDRQVAIDITGGTLDGLTMGVSSAAVLTPGDRAVLCLTRAAGGVRAPFAGRQGVLHLTAGNVVSGTTTTVDDLRALARARGKG